MRLSDPKHNEVSGISQQMHNGIIPVWSFRCQDGGAVDQPIRTGGAHDLLPNRGLRGAPALCGSDVGSHSAGPGDRKSPDTESEYSAWLMSRHESWQCSIITTVPGLTSTGADTGALVDFLPGGARWPGRRGRFLLRQCVSTHGSKNHQRMTFSAVSAPRRQRTRGH